MNYGWDGMNPDLVLADDDFIASSTEEVYSLLKERGITHVIYMGLHTNMCLFGKPGALKYMVQAGLNCMLARDINDAFTSYDPATGFTPDRGTQQTDEDLERAGVPTINLVEEWRKAGVWDDEWIVETVRITPWGKTAAAVLLRGVGDGHPDDALARRRRDPLHAGRQRARPRLAALREAHRR